MNVRQGAAVFSRLGAALLIGGIAACGNGATATQSSNGGTRVPGSAGVTLGQPGATVSATDQLTFVPATQTARVGQVIQWSNAGTVLHTVTFDAFPSLSDDSLQPGATWSVKFTQSGRYPYRCTIHPGMQGTLVIS